MSLIIQDVESEISYAYLHAVAGKASMSCKPGDRHDDSYGVDAEVNYRGITDHPYLRHVQLNIQLKATIKDTGTNEEYASYFLNGIKRFDKLRIKDSKTYKILVVLFLPQNPEDWIKCSADELILKRCAYWTCLYGAEESTNDTGTTIYLPRKQLLTPVELIRLANLAVHERVPEYQRPS
jgi:hypothetical protein